MKLRAERDTLVSLLTIAGRAVPSRTGAMPILNGIRLDSTDTELTATGSDRDTLIVTSGPIVADEPGSIVLPARLAIEVVRSLEPGVITVETGADNDETVVAGGRTNFTIRNLPVEEWPLFDPPFENGVTVPTDVLDRAVRQVLPAASRDDARPILTGVLVSTEESGLRLVATDSYRLAVRDLPGLNVLPSNRNKALIPAASLTELLRLLDHGKKEVTIAFTERDVQFNVGSTMLRSRLLDGEFPNYKGLIPSSYPNRFSVAREPFLEAARRVALMAREATPVRVAFTSDGMDLNAIAQDVGVAHEHVDGTYQGPDLTCGYNPNYLLAGAEVCEGDVLHIDTLDGLKPTLLHTDDPEFLYLIMPVRIS